MIDLEKLHKDLTDYGLQASIDIKPNLYISAFFMRADHIGEGLLLVKKDSEMESAIQDISEIRAEIDRKTEEKAVQDAIKLLVNQGYAVSSGYAEAV